MTSKKSATKQEPNQQALAAYSVDGEGDGFEEANESAFAVPRLKLLQKMSPVCDEDRDEYIEGAKAGMWFETSTQMLFSKDTGVVVVPCHYKRVFLEWNVREEGGGLVQEYDAVSGESLMVTTKKDDNNRDILPNGHELQDTRVHYVLIMDMDTGMVITPAVVSLTRTQATASRNWMSKMRGCKLPNGKGAAMFAQVYRLTSVVRTKDENSWSVMKDGLVGILPEVFPETQETVFQMAKDFRDMINSGHAKVQHDDEEKSIGGNEEEEF